LLEASLAQTALCVNRNAGEKSKPLTKKPKNANICSLAVILVLEENINVRNLSQLKEEKK